MVNAVINVLWGAECELLSPCALAQPQPAARGAGGRQKWRLELLYSGSGSLSQRRREAMTHVARRQCAPGLLAFEGDEPVGWVAVRATGYVAWHPSRVHAGSLRTRLRERMASGGNRRRLASSIEPPVER